MASKAGTVANATFCIESLIRGVDVATAKELYVARIESYLTAGCNNTLDASDARLTC